MILKKNNPNIIPQVEIRKKKNRNMRLIYMSDSILHVYVKLFHSKHFFFFFLNIQ